jgi:hypothetical protein
MNLARSLILGSATHFNSCAVCVVEDNASCSLFDCIYLNENTILKIVVIGGKWWTMEKRREDNETND